MRVNVADTLNENIEPWGGLVAKSRGAALDATDYAVAATHTYRGVAQRCQRSARAVRRARSDCQCARSELSVAVQRRVAGRPDTCGRRRRLRGRQFTRRASPAPASLRCVDTLSYYAGRHQLKTGFDFSVIDTTARLPLALRRPVRLRRAPGDSGHQPVPISAIQAVALGIPAAYFQGYGNSDASYPLSDLSVFAQDDWALRSNLTVKLGVRYQLQFWPERRSRATATMWHRACRLAWDPAGGKKTVLRAAYGVFHDNNVTTIVANTKALNGTTGVRSFVARLPSPIPGHGVELAGTPLRRAAASETPSLVVTVDPAMKTPYAHHLSAGVDREVSGGFLFAASVVYVRGFNFLGTIDYNPLSPIWTRAAARRHRRSRRHVADLSSVHVVTRRPGIAA